MAAIFSCVNGCVFHSSNSFVLPDKQYNSCWSQLVYIKALIIRRSCSFSFLQEDLSVWARNHMFLCKLQRRHCCHKTSLRLALVCHWVYRENPVLRVPKSRETQDFTDFDGLWRLRTCESFIFIAHFYKKLFQFFLSQTHLGYSIVVIN